MAGRYLTLLPVNNENEMVRKLLFFLLILLYGLSLQAQSGLNSKKSPVTWNGYSQVRFSGNFDDKDSFSIRRLKFWIQSSPTFINNWGFKIQTTFSGNQNEKFNLQDVMVYYKKDPIQIKIGQFVPQFSLLRFQPDYTIPVVERADVINVLIPDGTLGGRDLGVEANFAPAGSKWHMWLGAFNGYGIKDYRINNSGFLLTHKTAFNLFRSHLYAGYSIMYRKTNMLQFAGILPDSVHYTGNDYRYNIFALISLKGLQLQAEYIRADLGGKKSDGWYLMAWANLGKNQLVASWDNYNDLILNTKDTHTLHVGYNYLAKGDKLKFMIDNRFVEYSKQLRDYFLTLQVQLFFM